MTVYPSIRCEITRAYEQATDIVSFGGLSQSPHSEVRAGLTQNRRLPSLLPGFQKDNYFLVRC